MSPAEIQARIDALLKAAAPLRELDPDDPRAERLGSLVDQINALRAKQDEARRTQFSTQREADYLATVEAEGVEAGLATIPANTDPDEDDEDAVDEQPPAPAARAARGGRAQRRPIE